MNGGGNAVKESTRSGTREIKVNLFVCSFAERTKWSYWEVNFESAAALRINQCFPLKDTRGKGNECGLVTNSSDAYDGNIFKR